MAKRASSISNQKWPGAFAVFKPSLRTVAFNIWPFLGLYLLANVMQFVPELLKLLNDSIALEIISNIVCIVLSVLAGIGLSLVLLRALESKKISFNEGLSEAGLFLVRYLGLSILLGLIALGSLLLLIIPFFFIFPRIALAPYYLLDQDMGVIESLKTSWKQSQGNISKIYGVVGASIVMILPVFTIIGIPVALFLIVAYSAAFPILYKFVTTGRLMQPEATV